MSDITFGNWRIGEATYNSVESAELDARIMPDGVHHPAACPRCGKLVLPTGVPYTTTQPICYCGNDPVRRFFDHTAPTEPAPAGWRCPSCGRVFSPNTRECNYCNGQ